MGGVKEFFTLYFWPFLKEKSLFKSPLFIHCQLESPGIDQVPTGIMVDKTINKKKSLPSSKKPKSREEDVYMKDLGEQDSG